MKDKEKKVKNKKKKSIKEIENELEKEAENIMDRESRSLNSTIKSTKFLVTIFAIGGLIDAYNNNNILSYIFPYLLLGIYDFAVSRQENFNQEKFTIEAYIKTGYYAHLIGIVFPIFFFLGILKESEYETCIIMLGKRRLEWDKIYFFIFYGMILCYNMFETVLSVKKVKEVR